MNESTEAILNLVLCDTFFYIGESPHVINVLHELCVVLVKHSRPCAWVKFKKVRMSLYHLISVWVATVNNLLIAFFITCRGPDSPVFPKLRV